MAIVASGSGIAFATAHLALGAQILKTVNYTVARSGGPLDGLIVGHWMGAFVLIPTTDFAANVDYFLMGRDLNGTGTFSNAGDTSLRIAGTGRTAGERLRHFYRVRAGSTEGFAGTSGAEGRFTNTAQAPQGTPVFMVWGISYLEHLGTPGFYGWGAACNLETGVVTSHVSPTPIASGYLTATSGSALLGQIFASQGSAGTRTPNGLAMEQVALCNGDFPWDILNDANVAGVGRPHHDAVAALAGEGGNPFLTYEGLAAAQTAGTLPYPNCAQGRSTVDYQWTLRNLTDGLANIGTAGTNTLAITGTSGGISDLGSDIAAPHWYPSTPELNALTLSSADLPVGVPVMINILGTTSGSTIAVEAGALPTGLSLNSAARTISGTPTVVNNDVFTLRETLAGAIGSPRDTFLFVNVIATPTLGALTLSTATATQGAASTVNIVGATGGSTITLQSGSLPAGMTLDGAARTISGTPTTLGSSSFTLREALAGATNTPRDTALTFDVTEPGGVLGITNPIVRFTGGRGTRATVVIGTRNSSDTVQRRWVYGTGHASAGTLVPGFDWANIASQSGSSWQTSDALPVGGPYRLEVRTAAAPGTVISSDDWLVGTVVVTNGQSGMELAFGSPSGVLAASPPPNNISLPVNAGVQAVYLKLINQNAGGPTTYQQPYLQTWRIRGGETPATPGQGAIAFANEWHVHNPGHPVLIANQAINGSGITGWSNPDTPASSGSGGQDSFKFLGTIGAQPGPTNGNNSGVTEMYAAALGRHCDLHLFMWTPGINPSDATVRAAYRDGIDARFSNATSAPWVILPPWRGHRDPPDSSSTMARRQQHLDFVAELGTRGLPGPMWGDIVQEANNSLHAANLGAGGAVPDTNQVGQARLGASMGRAAAWVFDRTIKLFGPLMVAAWSDNGRATIQIELGRQVRTLNGAAISANQFWVSLNGSTFARADGRNESFSLTANPTFTVALDATGTRAILTPADGGTAWAAAGSSLRVDYARRWPFGPDDMASEANAERNLDGLLYDNQQHRGGTNFSAGNRAGNPANGTNRTTSPGIPVAARGAAKLVATERWTGGRTVTVRMRRASNGDVLASKAVTVTGS